VSPSASRALLLGGAGILVGLVAAWVAHGPGRIPDAVPVVAAGWVTIGCGAVAGRRVRWSRVGPLLVLVGFAWFVGEFSACLNLEPFTHRCVAIPVLGPVTAAFDWLWLGILCHAVLSFPIGRLRTSGRRAAALAGYAAAFAISAMPVGRLLNSPSPGWALPLAVAVTSAAILAVLLDVDARRVVLTPDRAVGLGDALATALGDPSFRVAFRDPRRDGWVDSTGRPVRAPRATTDVVLMQVRRDGEILAVVEHDAATMVDPQIRASVAVAVELAAHNSRLRADLDWQLLEVAASRRRLVDVALDERRHLAARVDAEVEEPLRALAEDLARLRAQPSDPGVGASVTRAGDHLEIAREEIHSLAGGLFPRNLETDGLVPALRDLAARSTVNVDLVAADGVGGGTLTDATVFFFCAEALANAARHARASRVRIGVTASREVIRATVEDDGVGGADPAAGSGLRGLRDRVEAIGGSLDVESVTGKGTRLAATIPVGHEARQI